MSSFDPDRFEDKYEHYFTELQEAYRRAFDEMSEEYDSDLIHAIDQRVLSESEPFYEGDGAFRVDLPDDFQDRLSDRDPDTVGDVVGAYRAELRTQLQQVFGFDP